jgi:hypothetical protein
MEDVHNTTKLSHQNHDLYVITQFTQVDYTCEKCTKHKLDNMVGNLGVMD